MNEITLSDIENVIGYSSIKGFDTRGWATFWCPFHDDQKPGGKPNFGVKAGSGQFKCFVCGNEGPSLYKLAKELDQLSRLPEGLAHASRTTGELKIHSRAQDPSRVSFLQPVIEETRSGWLSSSAYSYVTTERGINPFISAIYGLGYGMSYPMRARGELVQSAKDINFLMKNGAWMWSDSVVYADPPMNPRVINVRYLPIDYCRSRKFEMKISHRTWGDRVVPLGSWRITSSTKVILVLEGFFDMLAAAAAIHARGIKDVIPVYTNGSQPSYDMLEWFRTSRQDLSFVLVKDKDKPDKHGNIAGDIWETKLKAVIGDRLAGAYSCEGYDDPDKAFLDGWWPSVL